MQRVVKGLQDPHLMTKNNDINQHTLNKKLITSVEYESLPGDGCG